MADHYFFFLAALVVSTAAVPFSDDLQNDDSSTVTQCSVSCPVSSTSSKFSYEPGKTYEYTYESDIKTSVPGATEHSSLHMRSTIQLEVISTCKMVLRLTEVSLQDSDPTRYESRQHVRDVSKFRSTLQDKPMSFAFVDGEIQSVCPRSDDEPWAVNVRRAILSTLQNTMASLQGVSNTRETDVSGDCPVKYEVTNSKNWGHIIKVKKTKDLIGCTDRHMTDSILQGTSYLISSDIQSLPLLKSSHVCDQEINSKTRQLQRSTCTESHVFRPFSKAGSGATTELTYRLTFKRQFDGTQQTDGSSKVRSTLLYDHSLSASQQADSMREVQQTISQLCRLGEVDVRPEMPGMFTTLVHQMRRLDYRSLRQLHAATKSGMCNKAEKYFRDALPVVATTGSVTLMRDLINGRQTTDTETDVWLTSIAFIKNPTKDLIRELKPLLENNMARAALPVSSVINTFCQLNPTQPATPEMLQMVKLFEDQLSYNCRTDSNDQTSRILTALRAIGNAGSAASAVTATLNRCVNNGDIPTVIRVAAISAFRRIDCTDNNREELFKLLENKQADSELRINAYLGVMQCITEQNLPRIQAVLESEEVNQVGSFIWTHLTNLQETASPLKKDIRAILEDAKLKKEFDIDKRKFSRNIELSTFSELLNFGVTTESNLIWSTSSFVPRSASLNLTVDMFGQSINLFEVGGRVQGIEDILEQLFGPGNKDFDNLIKNRERRAAIKDDVFNTIDRRFSKVADNDLMSYYVRIFGNEIRAGDLFSFNLDGLKSRFNFLDWLIELAKDHRIDFTKNFHFLDTSIAIPTGTGFPIKLSAEGTATVALTANGKIDIRQMLSSPSVFDISGSIRPSAAIEIRGEMGVDAFVAKTGLKMVNTMHSSTILDGLVQLKDGRIFNMDLNMPQDKMEIFSAESHLYITYRDQTREQKASVADTWQWSRCTSRPMTDATGLELCAEASLPWGRDVKFPQIGAAIARVYLNKRDTYRGAHFETSYIPSNGVDTVRVSFNTPGSRVDREMTANFRLDRPQKQVHLDVKTPWKKATVDGSLVNRPEVKQATLKAMIDDTNEYSFNAEIGIEKRGTTEFKFSPKLEIAIPNRQPILFNGTLNYTKGRKAEMKLALKNAFRDPITADGSMTVVEKPTSTKYDVSMQIGSPIFKGTLTGYTLNSRDHGNSWASRAELKYSYRGGRQERILLNHKIRDLSSNNLKTYSTDGSWSTTLWPRYNGQAGLEISYSPNSLRTKIEAGLDEQRKVTIITSGAYDFSGRDKKLNGLVKFEVPYKDLNYEVKLDHLNNWNALQSNVTVKYTRDQQPVTASLDLGFKKESERPLVVNGEARIKYPGRDITITQSINERAPREYSSLLTVQMDRGYQARVVSTYKMSPRHEMTNDITIPNMDPIRINAHLKPDLRNLQVRAELGFRRKTYLLDGSWQHSGNLNAFNTRGSLEIGYANRRYTTHVEASRRNQEFTGSAEFKINQDRRYAISSQVTAALMTPKFLTRVEWPGQNFFELIGSGKYEHRGWYTTTNDLEGSIKATSSLRGLEQLGASFVHDQSSNNFKTNGEVFWAANKKITGELSADRTKAGLTLTTPFPGYQSIRADSTYSLHGRSGQLTARVQWDGGRQMSLLLSGDANQPDRLITGKVTFSSPFQKFENLAANFRHQITGDKHQTTADFSWARGQQVALTASMTHQRNGLEIANSGELTVTTPFSGYRINKLRWSHQNAGEMFKCKHELELEQGRKFAFDLDASHRLTRVNRRITARSTFQAPSNIADWLQSASFNLDYQHDLRAWKSSGKSTVTWGRYTFGYEHDVNIEPYQTFIVKAKVTTPFPKYQQMGIGLNNRRNGNQFTANNEILLGAIGKATLDGSLNYNLPMIDGMIRLTTPWAPVERIVANLRNTRQNDGTWAAHGDFQYATDKMLAIDGKFGLGQQKIVELEVTTPFQYLRQLKASASCSGKWRNLQASAEFLHNILSDKISLTISNDMLDLNNINSQLVIRTPFTEFSSFRVTGRHARDSRDHTLSTLNWEVNRYKGSALVDLNARGPTDFDGRAELEYINHRKMDLSGSFKIDQNIVATATFRSPFDIARHITFNFNEEGPLDNFKVTSEVSYNRNKRFSTQAEFTLRQDNLRTYFRLTTPLSGYERLTSTVNLSGRPTQFNLDSSFELNNQKIAKTLTFALDLNRNTLRANGKLETPFNQVRSLTYNVNHEGSWRDFTTTSSANLDGREITANAQFKWNGPSGKIELRTPFQQLSSFVVDFRHTTRPGRTFSGWSNQGSVELNGQRYTAESDCTLRGEDLTAKVIVKIPDEYSIRLTQKFKQQPLDFSQTIVAKLGNDRITRTVSLKKSQDLIDAKFTIDSTYRGYERFDASFKHEGPVNNFRTSASISTPFRQYPRFSTELSYQGTPSEFTSQLNVVTPFQALPRLSVGLNHRGNPSDLSSTLTISYNEQTITGSLTYRANRRGVEGSFGLQTPYNGYNNFQIGFTGAASSSEVSGSASLQTPIPGYERFSAEGSYGRNWKNAKISAKMESGRKPWSFKVEYSVPSLAQITATAEVTCPKGTTTATFSHSGDASNIRSSLQITTPYTGSTPITFQLTHTRDQNNFETSFSFRGIDGYGLTTSATGNLLNLQLNAELRTPIRGLGLQKLTWTHSYSNTNFEWKGQVETLIPGWERTSAAISHSGSYENLRTNVKVETSKSGYESIALTLTNTNNRRGIRTNALLETSIPGYNRLSATSDYAVQRKTHKWNAAVETPLRGYERFTAGIEHAPSENGDGFKTTVTATTPIRGYTNFGVMLTHSGVPSQFQTSLRLTTPLRQVPQIDISLNHRGSSPRDFATSLAVEYARKKIETSLAVKVGAVSRHEFNYDGSFKIASPCPYFRDLSIAASHNRQAATKSGKFDVTFNGEKKVDLDYSYATSGDRNINVNVRSPYPMATTVNMPESGQTSAVINWDTTNPARQVRFDFGIKDVKTSSLTDRFINFKTILPSRTLGFGFGYTAAQDRWTSHGELHWDQDQESDFVYDVEASRSMSRRGASYDGKVKVVSGLFNTDSSFSHKVTGNRQHVTEISLQAAERLVIKSDLNMANGLNHLITIQHPRFSKDVVLSTEGSGNSFKTTLSYERYSWTLEGTLNDESRPGSIRYGTSLRLSSPSQFDVQMLTNVASDEDVSSGSVTFKYLTSRDRQLKTLALRTEVGRQRRELKVELETPIDTFRLSTSNRELDLDNGVLRYDVALESNSINVRSTIDFSCADRSLDIKLYRSAESYAQLFGQFVSPTQMTLELNHFTSGQRANDAQLNLALGDDRVLSGRAYLRPTLWNDISGVFRTENFVSSRLNSDFNSLLQTLNYDLRMKNNFFQQSVVTPASNVANYVKSEVNDKLNQVKRAFDVMYRNNEFYMRDIHQALKRHYDDLSRRMQYKMAELRRSYEIWSVRLQDNWNDFADAWNRRMYVVTRRWEAFKQQVADQWQQIQPSLDQLRPYFDNFFDTVKSKLMDLFDRIRNCETIKALIEKLTSLQPSDYFLPPSQWQDRLLSYANRIDDWIAQYTSKPEVHYVREWVLNAIQQNKWLYQFLGVEQQIDAWIAEAKTMTWQTFKAKVRQAVENYLQLSRTRWTAWDPRRGEYAFEIYIPVNLPDLSTLKRLDPRPVVAQLKNWIRNQLPPEDLTLLDAVNLYKPPSDIRDWVPPFKSHATLTGSQHYMTFDRRFFEFAGDCSYLLARDFIGGTFSVIVNYDRPVRNQAVKKSLTIVSGGRQIEVFPDGKVSLDGTRVEMPIMVANTTVSRNGNLIRVADTFRGVDVTCDLPHDHCTLTVSGWYYGKTAGLLGTYDNEPSNDMTTIDKTQTTQPEELANGWTVGQRCRSSNRAITVPQQPDTRRYQACADLFQETTSSFRTCYRVVSPEPFMTMCLNDVQMGDNSLQAETDVCRIAAAYRHECRRREVHVRMPKQCVRCEVPSTRRTFYDEDVIRLDTPESVPRVADLVFVVEHGECNRNVLPKIVDLIDDLENAMTREGLSATRYAIVGFGGKQHLDTPHVHTMDGQIFNSANKVRMATNNFDFMSSAAGSDAMFALRYAAQLPFRAGASKTIVLVTCNTCHQNSTRYSEIQHILLANDIHLHVLVQDIIHLKSKSPKTAYIFGVEETTVYTRKDVAGDDLAGEPDLRRYVRLPKDLCVALTQDTNGAVFSVRQWLDSRPGIQKQFVDVLVRTLARKATPSQCQTCECMADEAGVGVSQCQSCQRRDPIYSLLPNFDDDESDLEPTQPLAPAVVVTEPPSNLVPKSTIKVKVPKPTPAPRRTVPPRATRRPTRRPAVTRPPPRPRGLFW